MPLLCHLLQTQDTSRACSFTWDRFAAPGTSRPWASRRRRRSTETRPRTSRRAVGRALEPAAPPRILDASPSSPRPFGGPMSTGAVAAIPIDRSTGLFRWNAVLHFLQFVAILALSFAKNPLVTSPVVGTY